MLSIKEKAKLKKLKQIIFNRELQGSMIRQKSPYNVVLQEANRER